MALFGFFPELFLENFKEKGNLNGIFPFYGTSLFVDLSGFTKISEFFAQFGKEGSETLTNVLNEFFDKFYRLLKKYDGDILRFAGDALTCFFKDDIKKEKVKNFSKELLKMMESFEEYKTGFGNITLKLKGGYSKGNIYLIVIGKKNRDYTFSGFGINKAIEAEKNASPQEIIEFEGEEKVEFKEKILEETNYNEIEYFIDPYLKKIIIKGEKELIGGHRKVAVLFIRIGRDFSFDEKILNFIEDFICVIKDYGGFLNKIDFSDKGNVLMVLFGAPLVKGEEVERALEFALYLKKMGKERNIPVKIGMNYENVYCGIVGSSERFEYTVMGDGVNLSARLMEISFEDEITCSRNFEEKSPMFYIFEKLPPVKLKGKEKPVEIYVLKGKKGEIFEVKELIGRKKELEDLNYKFSKFEENKTFLCFISGSSGIGKSQFINYFFDIQNLRGKNLIYSRCSSFTSFVSLKPLKELLIQCTGKFYKENIKKEILKILERAAPETKEYVSIIYEFLELEEKRETNLPPEVYKNLLNKFILLILEDLVKKENIYFFIDNAHFLDNETIDFIKFSLKLFEKKGFYLFISGREDVFKDKNIFDFDVKLKPFSEEETEKFILNYLKVKEVPEKALKSIYKSTGGNPQFIQEVLKLMLKSGYLERSEDFPEILILNETITFEIPETLEGIALKEFDLLSIEEKKILQIFSVIGENIPFELIEKLKIQKEIIEKIYKDGVFLGFNPEKSRYFFIKQTYRDAIYESLEYSFKRKLHKKIGEILEKSFEKDENLLAYHFYNSRSKKAIVYLDILYEKLKIRFSLKESFNILKNLIEIRKFYKRDIKKFLIELASLSLSIGLIKEAEKIIRENEEKFIGVSKSKALNVLGETLRLQGAFGEAEGILKESIKKAKEKYDRFKGYFGIGRFYSFLGNYNEAKVFYEKALNIKEFKNYPEYHSAKAYYYYILYETEKSKEAFEVIKKELKWFKRKNYFPEYLIFLNNLSNFYVYEGEFEKAIINYEKCLKNIIEYYFIKPDVIINLLLNISLLKTYLGKFDSAEDKILKAISYSKKFNSILLSKSIAYLSYLNLLKGNYKEMLKDLLGSINDSKNSNFPYDEFLQFGMDFAWETGNINFFRENLKEYKGIIERENLLFLRPTLLNYEAELSILEGEEEKFIEKEKINFKNCLEDKNFLDGYRALRFLYLATKDFTYLNKIEEIFKKFEHFIYKLEFLIFKYKANPDKNIRKKLINYLKKCPDNITKMKGYISLKDEDKKNKIYEKIIKNLPDGFQFNLKN